MNDDSNIQSTSQVSPALITLTVHVKCVQMVTDILMSIDNNKLFRLVNKSIF